MRGLRFPKRRADWLLGRWTAKKAVAIRLGLPRHADSLANIEIRQTPSGAPEVLVANEATPLMISLSHRGGRSICALAPAGEAVGCDLELVEPRSDAFVADYFAPEEQSLAARVSEADRPLVLALLWSAKESALKALGTGLRLDTRCVIVSPVDPQPNPKKEAAARGEEWLGRDERADAREGWRPLRVRHGGGQVFYGWWFHRDGFLRTAVTSFLCAEPILL